MELEAWSYFDSQKNELGFDHYIYGVRLVTVSLNIFLYRIKKILLGDPLIERWGDLFYVFHKIYGGSGPPLHPPLYVRVYIQVT